MLVLFSFIQQSLITIFITYHCVTFLVERHNIWSFFVQLKERINPMNIEQTNNFVARSQWNGWCYVTKPTVGCCINFSHFKGHSPMAGSITSCILCMCTGLLVYKLCLYATCDLLTNNNRANCHNNNATKIWQKFFVFFSLLRFQINHHLNSLTKD